MNIANVIDLVSQLEALGFRDMGSRLLKRICFKPQKFFLSQQIEKGRELLKVQILFQKRSDDDLYVPVYYDATLPEAIELPDKSINNVNISHLEKEMATVEWKKAFEPDESEDLNLEDKASWLNEQKIESIINDLAKLETSDEGKLITVVLKLKFWEGSRYNELVGNLQILKNTADVSQRFYLFPSQSGISVDEAFRFLQNKRLERRLLTKKKEGGSRQSNTKESTSLNSNGNGLNKNKRIRRAYKTKSVNE